MRKIGDRVGAVMSSTKDSVKFFGYGTYMGEEVPPSDVTLFGLSLAELGHSNPKIVLDSGKVVWGCECWWGGEEAIKKELEGKEIIEVDPEQYRKESRP